MKSYEGMRFVLIMFQDEDIVTLSGGFTNEGGGTDLGDGEVGDNDIFN